MSCSIESRVSASACYDCLDDHEKRVAVVYLKSLALLAAGGSDYTNPNVLREAAECLICGGIGNLKAFAVLNALALAESQGAEVPATASDLKAAIKCWCGIGQDELFAWESVLDCLFAESLAGFPTGATHYWALNEASGTRVDSIGSLDLSASGITSQITGPLDFAVVVNPSLATGKLQSSAVTSFRTSDWTFNFWYRAIGLSPGSDIIGQLGSVAPADVDFEIFPFVPATDIGVLLSDGSATTESDALISIDVNDGTFHMISVMFSTSGNTVTVYVDGQLQGSGVNLRAINPIAQPFCVGNFTINGANSEIAVSDVGIWPRLLAAGEIITLYNGGVPLRP